MKPKSVVYILVLWATLLSLPTFSADLPATPGSGMPIRADLRAKIISAIDSTMEIGNSDSARGQMLTDWNERAVNWYRAMGVKEEIIARKVTDRLETFFSRLADGSLPKLPDSCTFLLTSNVSPPKSSHFSSVRSIVKQESSFAKKYDLSHYRSLRENFGSMDTWAIDKGYYALSLKHAYALAKAVSNRKMATYALVQMIQFRQYEAAYKVASENGDDRALINIGFLILLDYYEGPNRLSSNTLWEVIEAFKRVQGPLKEEANQIMFDLAMEVTSPRTLQAMSAEEAERLTIYALGLLRSTGTFVRSVNIDSVKVSFITKVTNPTVVAAIKELLPRVRKQTDYDVLEARAAIGDVDGLNALADATFRERLNVPADQAARQYEKALDYFDMAGNTAGQIMVLNAAFSENIAYFPDFTITLDIVPAVKELLGQPGLAQTLSLIEKQSKLPQNRDGEMESLKDKLEKSIRTNDFAYFSHSTGRRLMSGYLLSTQTSSADYLISKQEGLRRDFLKIQAESTPTSIAEHKAKADHAMAQGQSWEAYQEYMQAMNIDGLIAAGDLMMSGGNGLNAISPYIAALVLLEMK